MMSETREERDGSVPATSPAAFLDRVWSETGTLQPFHDSPQSVVLHDTTTCSSTLSKVSDADVTFEYIDELLAEELRDRLRSFRRASAAKEERLGDYYRIRRIHKILTMRPYEKAVTGV
nr:uncharacterized protein LOC126545381 [Dermacentor andersoni]